MCVVRLSAGTAAMLARGTVRSREASMLYMGMLTAACSVYAPATASPLYALRRVPRRAIALLRMTMLERWLILLRFQDVTQQVWFGFVPHQMRIHFAAVVGEVVGFIEICLFCKQ